VRTVLLLVDVINDFEHEDGEELLASFRERVDGMKRALEYARAQQIAVVYANDNHGVWDGDAAGLVRRASGAKGGDVIEQIAPRGGDRFIIKPRYSGFDHTPLVLILRELDAELILLAGSSTEGCVTQTAIDGRELGFKITVLTDACATADPRLERISLEYLEQVVGARLARSTDL
jgi:nicotinamidase-related amidase